MLGDRIGNVGQVNLWYGHHAVNGHVLLVAPPASRPSAGVAYLAVEHSLGVVNGVLGYQRYIASRQASNVPVQ